MAGGTDQRGPFDNPVYKEISLTNGRINKMKKDEVKRCLDDLGLDTRGVKEVLQKRLKSHIKKEKLSKAKLLQKKEHNDVHYYCVIDFECTCKEENPADYKHEIIEFPAVLVNASTFEVEDEFHQYCRPLIKTQLTEFCQNLTGITQDTVDKAKPFPAVLEDFQQWLASHELGTTYKFLVVTDGPWDIVPFLVTQCEMCNLPIPAFAKHWINLRKHCRRFYKVTGSLEGMLQKLDLEFEGRPHSGIDDTRNIVRILQRLHEDDCEFEINEHLFDRR